MLNRQKTKIKNEIKSLIIKSDGHFQIQNLTAKKSIALTGSLPSLGANFNEISVFQCIANNLAM